MSVQKRHPSSSVKTAIMIESLAWWGESCFQYESRHFYQLNLVAKEFLLPAFRYLSCDQFQVHIVASEAGVRERVTGLTPNRNQGAKTNYLLFKSQLSKHLKETGITSHKDFLVAWILATDPWFFREYAARAREMTFSGWCCVQGCIDTCDDKCNVGRVLIDI